MEKVALTLRGKRRERKFSSPETAQEFIRLAAEKFGRISSLHRPRKPLRHCIEVVEFRRDTKRNGNLWERSKISA